MNAIGGYFELELPRGQEYHQKAIRLNTGRNAFEYILRAKKYMKVFLPYYTCDVMLEPINKINLQVEFYHIDNSFRPLFDFSQITEHDAFVYTNYFGICDQMVDEISQQCMNLIIDNSQAFYSKPLPGVDTFYSPRKFFGVSDGAYLYTDKQLNENLEQDISYERMSHLLKRVDCSAEFGFDDFKSNDDSLKFNPIKIMSKITKAILSSVNYEKAKQQRRDNFIELHSTLKTLNKLNLVLNNYDVPMVYPFYTENKTLRENLIKNKIYVATYWPNVMNWCSEIDLEHKLAKEILPLPIDQRFSYSDFLKIIQLIKNV